MPRLVTDALDRVVTLLSTACRSGWYRVRVRPRVRVRVRVG